MSESPIVRLHPEDSVAIATRPLPAGATVRIDGAAVRVADPIPAGHKLAVSDIADGEAILRYGQTIGFATGSIAAGSHVHTHNCSARLFEREIDFSSEVPPPPAPVEFRAFRGFERPDGRAGTRNRVVVASTVNCSASVARAIAAPFDRRALEEFPTVDAVVALTHKSGCGMRFEGSDHRQLERVLAGHARHPNVGGCLIVGLGCEIAQITHLVEGARLLRVEGTGGDAAGAPTLATLSIQEEGGIAPAVAAGREIVGKLVERAATARRVEVPLSRLVLALQCGGSDGWSGVTANPALGAACDRLVAHGATVVLAETPEIYGAEHLLARRAESRAVGEALLERIRWWEEQARRFGAEIDNNPTPGNKAGGITTIYEKSLGAVAKAGSTALRGVYRYAEPIREPGFVVMDTPGYDPVSLTGIVAGGANLTAFTTGRGSVYGGAVAPSLKISTNTPLAERMPGDIDIDAGVILSGTSLEELGERIFESLLEVAAGRPTLSEEQGIGEEEFAPWSAGLTL